MEADEDPVHDPMMEAMDHHHHHDDDEMMMHDDTTSHHHHPHHEVPDHHLDFFERLPSSAELYQVCSYEGISASCSTKST
jgi:hypothetical protein